MIFYSHVPYTWKSIEVNIGKRSNIRMLIETKLIAINAVKRKIREITNR